MCFVLRCAAEVFFSPRANLSAMDLRAILVIDMINDFVTGKLGFKRAREIVPNIGRLIDFARSKGLKVIYVCDAHEQGDHELKLWGPHALKGSEGAKVVQELKPTKLDEIVEKHTYSSFFGTRLNDVLQKLGVGELVLTGVVTEVCVQNTCADAFYLGYDLVVLKDCVASPDQKAHRASLDYMRRIFGAKVITSREFIRSMG